MSIPNAEPVIDNFICSYRDQMDAPIPTYHNFFDYGAQYPTDVVQSLKINNVHVCSRRARCMRCTISRVTAPSSVGPCLIFACRRLRSTMSSLIIHQWAFDDVSATTRTYAFKPNSCKVYYNIGSTCHASCESVVWAEWGSSSPSRRSWSLKDAGSVVNTSVSRVSSMRWAGRSIPAISTSTNIWSHVWRSLHDLHGPSMVGTSERHPWRSSAPWCSRVKHSGGTGGIWTGSCSEHTAGR